MKFFLEIELGNDAMLTAEDIATALLRTKTAVEHSTVGAMKSQGPGKVYDRNGQPVGRWGIRGK